MGPEEGKPMKRWLKILGISVVIDKQVNPDLNRFYIVIDDYESIKIYRVRSRDLLQKNRCRDVSSSTT